MAVMMMTTFSVIMVVVVMMVIVTMMTMLSPHQDPFEAPSHVNHRYKPMNLNPRYATKTGTASEAIFWISTMIDLSTWATAVEWATSWGSATKHTERHIQLTEFSSLQLQGFEVAAGIFASHANRLHGYPSCKTQHFFDVGIWKTAAGDIFSTPKTHHRTSTFLENSCGSHLRNTQGSAGTPRCKSSTFSQRCGLKNTYNPAVFNITNIKEHLAISCRCGFYIFCHDYDLISARSSRSNILCAHFTTISWKPLNNHPQLR